MSIFAGGNGQGYADGAAAKFSAPHGLAFDQSGNLYVADSGTGLIRKITPQAVVTTFAGSRSFDPLPTYMLYSPYDICFDAKGNAFVCEEGSNVILKISNE